MKMNELRMLLRKVGYIFSVVYSKKEPNVGMKRCSTEIWSAPDCDIIVLISTNNKGISLPVCTDRKAIKDHMHKYLGFRPKDSGMSVPCYHIKGSSPINVHQLVYQCITDIETSEAVEMVIDHIYHNRFFAFENISLRRCSSYQNVYNSKKALPLPRKNDSGRYCFAEGVYCDASRLSVFLSKGYKIIYPTFSTSPTWYLLESPQYADIELCCQEARSFMELVYGEYAYRPELDFEDDMSSFQDDNIGAGTALLLKYYVLHEIATYEDLVEANRQRLSKERYKGELIRYYMR